MADFLSLVFLTLLCILTHLIAAHLPSTHWLRHCARVRLIQANVVGLAGRIWTRGQALLVQPHRAEREGERERAVSYGALERSERDVET